MPAPRVMKTQQLAIIGLNFRIAAILSKIGHNIGLLVV